MRNLVPAVQNNSVQNELRNKGSLSDTIEFGITCKRTTSRANTPATDFPMKGCRRPMKWQYLGNRSTTINTQSNPSECGNPKMKSILISIHTLSRIGNGVSNPVGLRVSYLFFWHTSHVATNAVIASSFQANIDWLPSFGNCGRLPNDHLTTSHGTHQTAWKPHGES